MKATPCKNPARPEFWTPPPGQKTCAFKLIPIKPYIPYEPKVHYISLGRLERERFEEMARNGEGDLILVDCVYFDHKPFPVRVDRTGSYWDACFVPWIGY